jgi:hypothetical protein
MPADFNRRWSDAMDEVLIERWRDGDTATEIYRARIFPGFTRNAIIGRLWRLRKKRGAQAVSHRDTDPVPAPKPKRKKPNNYDVKREATREPTPLRAPPAPPAARRLSLFELGPRDCRFIITDNAPHLYCAVDASEFADEFDNNCYCAFHQRLMRASIAPRR